MCPYFIHKVLFWVRNNIVFINPKAGIASQFFFHTDNCLCTKVLHLHHFFGTTTYPCMYYSIGPTFHTIKEFQGRTTLESYLKKKIENWVLYLEHISLLSRKTLIPFELEIELAKCCQKYILDKDTISSWIFFYSDNMLPTWWSIFFCYKFLVWLDLLIVG